MLFRKKKTYIFTFGMDNCFCKIDAYDQNSAIKLFKQQYGYVRKFAVKEEDKHDLVHKRHALLSR